MRRVNESSNSILTIKLEHPHKNVDTIIRKLILSLDAIRIALQSSCGTDTSCEKRFIECIFNSGEFKLLSGPVSKRETVGGRAKNYRKVSEPSQVEKASCFFYR